MSMTIEQIITQARYRADMLNSTFVSDAEAITYVNKSLNELYDILVGALGEEYFVTTDANVTDGTNPITLPTNFYKATGVDMTVAGNVYTLERFSFAERNKYRTSGDAIAAGIPRHKYRIIGNSLYLYPVPEAGYTIDLWYVPRMTDLTTGQSTENTIVESWIEYVIVDVAIKMLIKEESDVSALLTVKQDIVQRIAQLSKVRDYNGSEVQQDINTTLFNLRTQTRHRSTTLNDLGVSDTEINIYINDSMRELHDLLITSYGTEHFVDGYVFSTVASQEDYPLPENMHKLVALDIVSPINSKTYSLEKFNFSERNVYKNATDYIVDGIPRYRYRLLNHWMRIAPAPEQVYSMTMWYIPQLANLSGDMDYLETRTLEGWKEYIVIDAAIKVLGKLGKDTGGLNQKKQEISQRIASIAGDRNVDVPEITQDPNITLLNLRVQSRYRANTLNSDAVTDTELNHYINNSMTELYDILIKAQGTENFIDGYAFSVTTGDIDYQLPDNFHKLVGVDMFAGSKWHSVQKFNFSERNVYENAPDEVVAGVPRYRYRLINNYMRIFPTPTDPISARMWYIPQVTKLTTDTMILNSSIINGWEEYVIIDAAIKMTAKLGGDVSVLSGQKAAMGQRISELASMRNLDQPEVTQDSTPTLFNLRIQSRYRADVLNSDSITDTELNHYINNSLGELYEILMQSYGTDNFIDGYEFSTAVGDTDYDLPTDMYRELGLDLSYNSKFHSLQKFNWSERNIYENATDHIVDGNPRYKYRLIDEVLRILPAPERVYPMRLYYIPEITKLTTDLSAVENSIIESWLEYVIIDAAIKMKTKLGSDVVVLGVQKAAMLDRITAIAGARNLDVPEVTQDSDQTLFNLRIQSRYRADAVNNEKCTDTEINHYINNSLGELHGLLVRAYGNDYFLDGYEFSTVSGREDYNLPTDFFKLGGLDINNNGYTYTLDKFNFGERNLFKNAASINRGGIPWFQYRLYQNSVRLLPAPEGVYNITLWYTPQHTVLTSDTDKVHNSIIRSWLEYVIVDVAIKIKIRTGGNIGDLNGQKAALIERVTQMAENRDWGRPDTVTDVTLSNVAGWDF